MHEHGSLIWRRRDYLLGEKDATSEKIVGLKSDLDKAKTELQKLTETTKQIQRKLADSKEDELREAARAWSELCSIAALGEADAQE